MAATVATAVGDATDGIIIGIIVFAKAGHGFTQELRVSRDVQLLLSSVSSTVDVDRHGETPTLVIADVRAGDNLHLSAGDVVPGECRLISAEGRVVDESALTGGAIPVQKSTESSLVPGTPLAVRTNCVFRGTHVVSGTDIALVVYTGRDTEFWGGCRATAAASGSHRLRVRSQPVRHPAAPGDNRPPDRRLRHQPRSGLPASRCAAVLTRAGRGSDSPDTAR